MSEKKLPPEADWRGVMKPQTMTPRTTRVTGPHAPVAHMATQRRRLLFVGSLGNGSISTFWLTRDGRINTTAAQPATPISAKRSWAVQHTRLPILYVADGVAGALSAWRVHDEGGLISAGATVAVGSNPVIVTMVGTSHVVSAMYGAGCLAVVRLDPTSGCFEGAPAFTNHSGRSACSTAVGTTRQTSPHPHGVFVRGATVLSPDLGLDKIFQYKFVHGRLIPAAVPYVVSPLCSGPRHLQWSKSGKVVVVVHEMGNTISVYKWDETNNLLSSTPMQPSQTTVPDDFGYCVNSSSNGRCSKAAEVRLFTENGTTVVWVANRGHNSIRHFLLNEDTGVISDPLGIPKYTTGLMWPRSFSVDPVRRLVIVAERGGGWTDKGDEAGGSVAVFKIGHLGHLTKVSGTPADTPGFVLVDNAEP